MTKTKGMSITLGSKWRWVGYDDGQQDHAIGSVWVVVQESTKPGRAGIKCISGDETWVGRVLPNGDPTPPGWESADDPFVVFVRETIEDHKNDKR